MTREDAFLFLIVAIIGTNQLVMRIPALYRRSTSFWSLQVMVLSMGLYVLVRGMPGFEHVPPLRWVLGLIFITHAVQNLRIRQRYQAEERSASHEADRAEREEKLRAALAASKAPKGEADG